MTPKNGRYAEQPEMFQEKNCEYHIAKKEYRANFQYIGTLVLPFHNQIISFT